MSTLAGNAARLLAACLPMLCVSGVARADSCVSASWYHEGSHTASGERYRPDGLTAAHRSLRLGTRLRVTNRRNGRSVVVRVNDRGPAAWTHRGIDLSRGAARVLGIINAGVGPVCYQVVDAGHSGSRMAGRRHAEAGEALEERRASSRGRHGRRVGRLRSRHSHRLAQAAARKLERAAARHSLRSRVHKAAHRGEEDNDA